MPEPESNRPQPIGPRRPGTERTAKPVPWYRYNLEWKIFSIILAVGIWLIARYELLEGISAIQSARTWTNVPVLLLVRPGDQTDYQIEPGTIAVTVEGDQSLLDSLKLDQIIAWVDARQLGGVDRAILPVKVYIPIQCQIIGIGPEQVEVRRSPAPANGH